MTADNTKTLLSLWRQFIPLSVSDVTMACGDPAIATTLAHLPFARLNLAAVGVAKAIAIFFESPIITILHASNALAPTRQSRRALWRFTSIAAVSLSFLLALLTLTAIYAVVSGSLLGVSQELRETVRHVLTIMILWPSAIAVRRYFQGLLIYAGNTSAVAYCGVARLVTVLAVLAAGFRISMPGALLAGSALVAGVVVEGILVTWAAIRSGATRPPKVVSAQLPSDLPSVWRFYYPLASSMLVVWGGRAMLVGIIARTDDAQLALAAWTTAWGLVMVIANATRMVQQVIIRNRRQVEDRLLIIFALTVGSLCSLLLLLASVTPAGEKVLQSFVGGDRLLVEQIRPVLILCSGVPLLVAVQNAIQGFSIGDGRTHLVNLATWVGTFVLLCSTFTLVQANVNGAISAALAMVVALVTEIACLAFNLKVKTTGEIFK